MKYHTWKLLYKTNQMKTIALSFAILLISCETGLFAQTEGTITYYYNRKKLGIRYESQLKFKGVAESVYIQRNEEKTFQHVDIPGETTVPRYFDDWYIDTKLKQGIKQVHLKNGTTLYATFTPEPLAWEIKDETKTILGYKVQKAIVKKHRLNNDEIENGYGEAIAWFAIDLPNSAGPLEFWGLPGIILELTFSKYTSIVIQAESLNLEPVGDIKPSGGILVSTDQIENPSKINAKWLKQARELLNNDN